MNIKLILKRILFYIVSFTWGFIMSFIGLIIIGIFACMGKVHHYHGRLYAVVGHNWGGLELGCFFLCCEESKDNDHLRGHEMGHGLQNCLWGPLGIFVIFIPSAVRYWYRELKFYKKGLIPPTEYDDIWFEGQATKWGAKYVLTDRI